MLSTGGFNKRNLFSHSPGKCPRSGSQLIAFGECSLPGLQTMSLHGIPGAHSTPTPPPHTVCEREQTLSCFFSYKDINPIGLETDLITSFKLNYLIQRSYFQIDTLEVGTSTYELGCRTQLSPEQMECYSIYYSI